MKKSGSVLSSTKTKSAPKAAQKATKTADAKMTKAKAQEAPSETTQPIELVFGLVGPTGVDLDRAIDSLKAQLATVQYESIIVSLSDLLLEFYGKTIFSNEHERISELISCGNRLRESAGDASIVARMGLVEIREQRKKISGYEDTPDKKRRIAYIVRSFKRQEEVSLYRDVYGKAFTLISLYAPKATRVKNLSKRIVGGKIDARQAESLATELVIRDNKEEGEPFGQRVGSTFPMADFFASFGPRVRLDSQFKRLVRLTFGDPYISPTKEEEGMFFAQAAALRSLDLSRQVGAALFAETGEIISTGCNDVPKAGGGLYWTDDHSYRDHELGYDANVAIKKELVADAYRRLREADQLKPEISSKSDQALAIEALFGERAHFKESLLFDVIEFGRAVHAEMDSITQAARVGTSTKNGRLFCTTFPCHICARHIVSAGLREVFFIEPYEKSRTGDLFSDSISIEPSEPSSKLVNFHAFVGVSPRRYMDFFQASAPRKNGDGTIIGEEKIAKFPRVKRIVLAYTLAEEQSVKEIPPSIFPNLR